MFTRLLTKPRMFNDLMGNLKQKWEVCSRRLTHSFFSATKGKWWQATSWYPVWIRKFIMLLVEFNSLTWNWINILNESQKDTDKIQMSLKETLHRVSKGLEALQKSHTWTYARLLMLCQELRPVASALHYAWNTMVTNLRELSPRNAGDK